MGWMDKLRVGGRAPGGRVSLAELIGGYPPYRPAVAKPFGRLSEADGRANLDKLMADRPARLAGLGDLLARFGIDLAAGLEAPDPAALLNALWRWTLDEWAAIRDPGLLMLSTWLDGERRESPVFGLLTDVGLVLGEAVVRRRPEYAWALNLDPADRNMASWRRPCVVRPSDGTVPVLVYDPEAAAQAAWVNCTSAPYRLTNDLAQGALDHIHGAHERLWREDAAALGRSALPELAPDDGQDEPD